MQPSPHAPVSEYHYPSRLFRLVLGTVVSALGVVMMLQADVGLEPWSVFHQGLEKTIGITFGTASIVAGLFAILAALLLGESFGIGTITNTILCGLVIDGITALQLIPQMTSPVSGILMLLAGLEVLALGTWLYMASALGSGPRDALTVALARKAGIPVGLCRICIDVTVTVLGFLMGGKVGIGTVLAAILFGSMMGATFRIVHFRAVDLKQENILETLRHFSSCKK